jgi:protein SCO1/2
VRRSPIPLVLLLAAACSSSGGKPTLAGSPPPKAYVLPTATFTSSGGGTTAIPTGNGKITLLYVGYTGCPDVCPLIMADTALALRTVKSNVADRVQVVMITSDPVRDTPTALKTWLAGFTFPPSTTVLGLTSDWATIHTAATSIGVPLPDTEPATVDQVGHGAQLQAFGTDGQALDFLLPSDPDHLTKDLEHDLPLLLSGQAQ